MKTGLCINRRGVLGLGACGCASLLAAPAMAAGLSAVAELFTSQGCSSCPPADQFAGEIRRRPGVIVLTYHVDYWDYLGWKDTLATPDFSNRQYAYAKARGDMDVYTPQMIINGGSHYVGSRKAEVLAALDRAAGSTWPASVTLTQAGGQVAVEIGDGGFSGEATLWLMPLQPKLTVKVEKGEIAGQEITYHNIVRRIVPGGMWSGKAARFVLPADAVLTPECSGCAAILQRGKAGPILGVGTWGDVTGA